MTSATLIENRAVYTPPSDYRLTAFGLMRSEWTKFWSLRSSWIVLVCAALFGAGIAVAVSADYSANYDPSADGFGMAPGDVLFGFLLSGVFIAVLGALFITGEYTTGSIRSTMSAAPRRTGVLWAKAAVFAAVVVGVYSAVVLATFYGTQAILSGTDLGGASLSDATTLRVLTGYVATIAYLGLLGLALGAILRNSAGSIAFYIGVIMIVPQLATMLPWQWVADAVPYTPGEVVNTLSMSDTAGANLTLGESWTWMGIWIVVTFGLAAVLLRRRDV